MSAVLSYRDVLSKQLIARLHECPKTQTSCRTNYTSWQKELVRASSAILVFDLPDDLRQEVVKYAKNACDELNKYQTIHALYHKMMPNSYITWHQDQSWKFGMTIHLNEYWDEIMGSNVNCTLYFQERIFAFINKPLVLAFNEFHRLFEHPEITQDVMALLRFWHEQSKQEPIWENLRLIIVHSLKKFISIDPNHSPFNVGLSLEMPYFSVAQIKELANCYGLNWDDKKGSEQAEQLLQLLGGHPYLVNLAFHYLLNNQLSWISLLNLTSPAIAVYRNFLDNQLRMLEQQPELIQALTDVLAGNHRLGRTSLLLGQLQNLGLIRMQEQQAYLLCELYHRYFSDRLLLVERDE